VDLEKSYKPLMLRVGRQYEPEDRRLMLVRFSGLVMPRLAQMRPSLYPPIDWELKKLAETLEALDWGVPPASPVPAYCLLRVIDVTVEPGKRYRYRLQVRMANPNLGHKDVASPDYARDKELTSATWFEVPQTVVVPPEIQYYAVDQLLLEKEYEGPNARENVYSDRQTVLQVHRWLDHVPCGKRDHLTVGEWSIAERLVVYRGEYVGRKQKVELPCWIPEQQRFRLAVTPAAEPRLDGSRPTGVEVSFAYEPTDTLLVDFEGGETFYRRAGGVEPVHDFATTEVLLLSPGGKLLARDSVTDARDPERNGRLEAWRCRIKELQERKEDGDGPRKAPKDPFDP
jgi:hypothetical protein